MGNGLGLLLGLALALALLVVLRWIAGGRRRASGPRRPRAAPTNGAWSHVGARRRDLASTGSWDVRLR